MSNLSKINEMIQGIIKFLKEDPVLGNEGTSPFGSKMYSFGVLSDIHLRNPSFNDGNADFIRAVQRMEELKVDFVCIAGDIGYDSTAWELTEYKKILGENNATVPYYAVTGNHDVYHDVDEWNAVNAYLKDTEIVKDGAYKKSFEIIKDGDVFLFMSLAQTEMGSRQATPYGENLEWLQDRLARYKGARIFVFMHYPITGCSGLLESGSYQYYGFSSASTEDDVLLSDLLITKNTTVFSGHTHFKFDCENDLEFINVYTFQNKDVSLVHVPSCAYPRNILEEEEQELSEGYVVDVYETGVILRGVNLVTGDYMPEYEYVLTVKNNPAIANAAAINLSTSELTLISNAEGYVDVTLTDPANATITFASNNSNITVSPASLTFTESNYNESQRVMIKAGKISVSGSATITVKGTADSGTEMATRLISVELSDAAVEGGVEFTEGVVAYAPKDGDLFTGTVENHQISTNGKNKDTYNLTFNNFHLSNTNSPVFFPNSGDVVTITLVGDNSVKCTADKNTAQRIISSSATTPNQLIGDGEGAALRLIAEAKHVVIKGDYIITNADVALEYNGTMTEYVAPVSAIDGQKGITISGSGSFSINGACVKLTECEGGTLTVNLDKATPGTSAITITATPKEGYVSSGNVLVNVVPQAIDTVNSTVKMPATGQTLNLQGMFTAST